MSVSGSDLPGRMRSVTLVSGTCAFCAESSLGVSFQTGFLRRRNGCQPIIQRAGIVALPYNRTDVRLLCNRLRSVPIGNQGGFTALPHGSVRVARAHSANKKRRPLPRLKQGCGRSADRRRYCLRFKPRCPGNTPAAWGRRPQEMTADDHQRCSHPHLERSVSRSGRGRHQSVLPRRYPTWTQTSLQSHW